MNIEEFGSDYSLINLALLYRLTGISQKDIEQTIRRNSNTVWRYIPGDKEYKYLYYLIGSCEKGFFLQIVLTSESGNLTYLQVKKAGDQEIQEHWCNVRRK